MEPYKSFIELATANETKEPTTINLMAAFNQTETPAHNSTYNTFTLNAPHMRIGQSGRILADLYIEKYLAHNIVKSKEEQIAVAKAIQTDSEPFYGDIPNNCHIFSDVGLDGDVLYSTGNANEIAIGKKNEVNLAGRIQLPNNWHTVVVVVDTGAV